ESDFPELSELPAVIQEKGWITLSKNYQLFLENMELLKGNNSIFSISEELSVPVSLIIEFIIFLKSRDFLDIYRRK
ncbi:MAG: hypothetical protein V3V41_07140, partial [Candidatus Heimdallarchaeota archaeon]